MKTHSDDSEKHQTKVTKIVEVSDRTSTGKRLRQQSNNFLLIFSPLLTKKTQCFVREYTLASFIFIVDGTDVTGIRNPTSMFKTEALYVPLSRNLSKVDT